MFAPHSVQRALTSGDGRAIRRKKLSSFVADVLLAVEDGLDIVAGRIEQEGAVIAGVIIAQSGRAISRPPAARPAS